MSAKPILYYHNVLSPPSRAVLLVGAELGIEFDLRIIDLLALEQKKPEFIALNPQHTIPLLDDNGIIVSDSHAICAYLVSKYAKSDRLYPKDLAKRALVDSRLHFDSGHFFCRLRMLFEPIFYHKSKEMPEYSIKYIQIVWDHLNRFVEKTPYVAGDDMTIADFCILATATSLTDLAPMDPVSHKAISEWIKRMSKLPYYEQINAIGAKDFQAAFYAILEKNRSL